MYKTEILIVKFASMLKSKQSIGVYYTECVLLTRINKINWSQINLSQLFVGQRNKHISKK